MKHNLSNPDYVKIAIVFFIVCLVFVDISTSLASINNRFFKILLLCIILVTMLYDLHTGILLTVLFLMLLIQFNKTTLDAIGMKKFEMFSSFVPAEYTPTSDKSKKESLQLPECDNKMKNAISNDIFNYSVDAKVKPYEVFVKMLTTKDHLDNASNSAYLQPEAEELL